MSIIHTAHDHSEDTTQAEIRESAYRRGFHQCLSLVYEQVGAGMTPQEIKEWLKRVAAWRYRLAEPREPRDHLSPPPPPKP